MYKVLLVDDEVQIIQGRSRIIQDLGYLCLIAQNGQEAIEVIHKEHPDVVLTDIKMPQKDGFDVLKAAKEFDANIIVILFTGYASIDSAVQAMRQGAFDYIQKPVTPEAIEAVLKKALDQQRSERENSDQSVPRPGKYYLPDLVGECQVMQEIAERVQKVAKSEANVLIYGESGTGKEMIAKNIHRFSRRSEQPFIPLDCVALPTNLLESEIFGYEKGAFTGAISAKPGLLEIAHNGTLFLDEITELDINLQAKLLRVLQERQFRRIGSTKIIHVNVRIISATNVVPEKAVKENKLRQDLYFRLNVVPIILPPLRNRKEDIPILVQHFIQKFTSTSPREIKGITREAMKELRRYNWPGNVRELQNIIEQAMSLSENDLITPTDLPDAIKQDDTLLIDDMYDGLGFQEAKERLLQQFTKNYINSLLAECNGNVSEVARRAGISRWSIYRMLKNGDT